MMPSDAIGLIVGFGFWLAVMNAYILSLAPANHTQQEFQLQIELDIRGGVK